MNLGRGAVLLFAMGGCVIQAQTISLAVSNIPSVATRIVTVTDGPGITGVVYAGQDFTAGTATSNMDIAVPAGGPYRVRAIAFVSGDVFPVILRSGKVAQLNVATGVTVHPSISLADIVTTRDASTPTSGAAGGTAVIKIDMNDTGDIFSGTSQGRIWSSTSAFTQNIVGTQTSGPLTLQGGVYQASVRVALPSTAGTLFYQFAESPAGFSNPSGLEAPFLVWPNLDNLSPLQTISVTLVNSINLAVSNIPAIATRVVAVADGSGITGTVYAGQNFAAGTASTSLTFGVPAGGPYRVRAIAFAANSSFPAILRSGKVTVNSVAAGSSVNASIALTSILATRDPSTPASGIAGANAVIKTNISDAGDLFIGTSQGRIWSSATPFAQNLVGTQISGPLASLGGGVYLSSVTVPLPAAGALYYQFGESPLGFSNPYGFEAPFFLWPNLEDGSQPQQILVIPPSLTISKTHAGIFTQGQTNATYTVTVSNASGASPTNGTVTVTESVPSGLTLVSMAGAGWACPGTAANNCTRSDALAAGASYPVITVTVNVAAAATSPQVNSVSVAGGGAAGANQTDSTTIGGTGALRFVPVTPCRVADTRKTAGPFGAPSIAGGASRDFVISSSACGIPPAAKAFSLNVAVVPPGALGFLTLYPAGQTRPVASTLNSLDGRIKSNAAIVPAGAGGAVSVYASNLTDVVLDINGYFVPATDATALAFYPVTPCRIADTRKPTGALAGPSLVGQQSRTFPIQSGACNLPAAAKAYSLNLAAVPKGALGFLTAFPTGQTRPVAANLNAPTGTVTANAAIVPAGTNGSIDVFASNTTDLVIDVNGYFAPMTTGGLSLYGVTPCRLLDTRKPAGSPPITSLDVAVSASACGISGTAQAYVFGVAAVPPGPLGFLTLWPQGQTRPGVATLNASDAAITSNMAIVPTTNGSISAFGSNPTHLVLDILGYFGQ